MGKMKTIAWETVFEYRPEELLQRCVAGDGITYDFSEGGYVHILGRGLLLVMRNLLLVTEEQIPLLMSLVLF